MKLIIYSFVLCFCFTGLLLGTAPADPVDSTSISYNKLEPEPYHRRVEQLVTQLLLRNHYKHIQINDSLSSQMFDQYIKILDYNRCYFLASDIALFEKYRYKLDDSLRSGNVNPAYAIFNIFQQRFLERMNYIFKRLNQEFDFTVDEYLKFDRSEEPWLKTATQLDSVWRKRLKNEALNLKLTGKERRDISETLQKRYRNFQKRINQRQSEDIFQLYMNSFAVLFDPHTNYMSPKLSEDFKIQMSHSLEGIGALLRTDNDYTQVVRIIPGGPADKSGLLQANDRITAVGQGEDGEMVDVIGWRLDDVVQLIRGPKSTTVRLQIIPANAALEDPAVNIHIVREKVKLEDRAAKSDTLEIMDEGRIFKIGVIDIPDFYFDFDAMRKGDKNYKCTTRDVIRLIGELQSAGVDGIIIDLRQNGGGFLNEAIDLTGLFIKDGPVVQVRRSNGKLNIESDLDSNVYYDGHLAVLVDRLSASASEIFAAAIQDYGRGIIIGNQTFGKGTVQNVIKLKRFFPKSKSKKGQVKLTIAKFYRVNGGSTQHKGVLPDIELPSRFTSMKIGESINKTALLWDEIKPVSFNKCNFNFNDNIQTLYARHNARIAKNRKFQYLIEDIEKLEKDREEKLISLQEEKRKKKRDEAEAKKAARKKEKDDEDENKLSIKNEDLIVMESAHILSDMILLSQ
jgi:carboxyl-terminal processing protease